MMVDTLTMHLRFAVDTSLGVYQDTLVFTEQEWATRDQKAIDVAKQALADKWATFRRAQIQEEDALQTQQGKQEKIAELTVQIADLTATKTSLEGSL